MKLTEKQIEQIVDRLEEYVPPLSGQQWNLELKTALATITISQPKQIDLGAFLLTQIIRMEDDKRKHFIQDLMVRYKDDQPKQIDLNEVESCNQNHEVDEGKRVCRNCGTTYYHGV